MAAAVGERAVKVLPHDFEGAQRAARGAAQMSQQRRDCVEAIQPHKPRAHAVHARPEPQHGAGDHAQRALAADKQLLEVVAGVVFQHAVHRREHRGVGEHGFEAEHLLAHHAVADHRIAAGVGGDRAADRSGPARAEVQREGETFRLRPLLHGLQHGARLHRHRRALGVYLLDPVHPLQTEQNVRGRGVRAGDQTRAAAVGHDRLARRRAAANDQGEFFGRGRAHDCARHARRRIRPAHGAGRHLVAGEDRGGSEVVAQLLDYCAGAGAGVCAHVHAGAR